MKKSARARQFTPKAREEIYARDRGCIFCDKEYHMEKADYFMLNILEVMHVVPKSQGGLGVATNGVLGCKYHHTMMDNGNEGLRDEMIDFCKEYLGQQYDGWAEADQMYSKW